MKKFPPPIFSLSGVEKCQNLTHLNPPSNIFQNINLCFQGIKRITRLLWMWTTYETALRPFWSTLQESCVMIFRMWANDLNFLGGQAVLNLLNLYILCQSKSYISAPSKIYFRPFWHVWDWSQSPKFAVVGLCPENTGTGPWSHSWLRLWFSGQLIIWK